MNGIEIENLEGKKIDLSEEHLTDMDDRLRGLLLREEDEGYEEAREIWNGMVDRKPALIIRCFNPADVKTAVDFVREHQLKSSIRAGGHNVSGASIADQGLVIDVSQMQNVLVDPDERTAVVESGALLGDLDRETAPFDLAAPVGVVSETGVAGLTLHGGVGWLTRKHGLSIDNLKSIEIVTGRGDLLKASEEENQDLFWALRGGGGNFGVVTAFEFDLHPVPSMVSVMITAYPLGASVEVMKSVRDYMTSAPEELMLIASYGRVPEMSEIDEEHHGKPALMLLGCYSGEEKSAEQIIGPLRTITEPIADLSSPMKWKELQQIFDKDYPDGKLYYWKSIYLDRLDDEIMTVLEKYTRSQPSNDTTTDIWFIDGAMNRVPPEATAFFNRQYSYMLGIEANWSESDRSEANITWARKLYSELEKLTSGGSYLNFPGNLEKEEIMLRSAYGDNLNRLKEIKAKYDPDNIMPGLLNISSA